MSDVNPATITDNPPAPVTQTLDSNNKKAVRELVPVSLESAHNKTQQVTAASTQHTPASTQHRRYDSREMVVGCVALVQQVVIEGPPPPLPPTENTR